MPNENLWLVFCRSASAKSFLTWALLQLLSSGIWHHVIGYTIGIAMTSIPVTCKGGKGGVRVFLHRFLSTNPFKMDSQVHAQITSAPNLSWWKSPICHNYSYCQHNTCVMKTDIRYIMSILNEWVWILESKTSRV